MMSFDFSDLNSHTQQDTLLDTIVDRTKQGKVVPILSNVFFCNLLLQDKYQNLVEAWREQLAAPDQLKELAAIAQYGHISMRFDASKAVDEIRVKEDYLKFLISGLEFVARQTNMVSEGRLRELKANGIESVSNFAADLDFPSVSTPHDNPLLQLAALPIPLFVTTSPHRFLERALRHVHKKPQTDFARWHSGLSTRPSVFDREPVYTPDCEHPLVYHLHGIDEHPESLVLTEDDHLDFLANLARNEGLHPHVARALTESMLLMLGYNLHDWEFKVLFRGVVVPRPKGNQFSHVAIQLEDERYLFSVDTQFISELDKRALSEALREEFQSHKRPLTDAAAVTVEEAGSKWKIVDAETYFIKNEDQTLNVYDERYQKDYIRTYLRQANFDVEWADTREFVRQISQMCQED